MPTQLENPFISFEFTPQELAAARNVSPLHKAYYQTLLCDAATSRLALVFDPARPEIFLQQEAYIKGQVDILNMILGQDGKAETVKPEQQTKQQAT